MSVDAGSGVAAMTARLLLGDGRFPAGGHVHSAGVEAAVTDGRIRGIDDLTEFVDARLRTAGLVDAALAAATVLRLGGLAATPVEPTLRRLDAEAAARIAAPPLRDASRRLGRQLVRVAVRCWPGALLDSVVVAAPAGAHFPVALGAVGVAAGLDADDAAALAVHHAVTTPAQAAVRLLGLDPFEVAALTARVAQVAAAVVGEALEAATGPLEALPALTGPIVEIAAVDHHAAELRLFAT